MSNDTQKIFLNIIVLHEYNDGATSYFSDVMTVEELLAMPTQRSLKGWNGGKHTGIWTKSDDEFVDRHFDTWAKRAFFAAKQFLKEYPAPTDGDLAEVWSHDYKSGFCVIASIDAVFEEE